MLQILEERMRKGELTFADAMHIYANDLTVYKKLAEKYRYRLYIIDFTNIEYDELLYRNSKRKSEKWVYEDTIKRVYKLLQEKKIYQIHDHRNHFNIEYNNYEYSYNLDGNKISIIWKF